ncbi:MAG: hypothetical protein ACOY3Z_08125 [Thermodesulfobacteriota bacterium]
MNPEKMMDIMTKELEIALKGLAKAKSVEDKVAYSKVVKNLSESLGVFLGLAGDMMDMEFDED